MKKFLAVLICILIFAQTAFAFSQEEAQSIDTAVAENLGCKPGMILAQKKDFPAGNAACDWLSFSFALSGVEECYADYLERLSDYVSGEYKENGSLSKNKATDYHRIALTVLALGGDPTHFGKKNDIDLIRDGILEFDDLGKQGLNGKIYALLVLDACGYEIPSESSVTRESLAEDIANAQEDDGSFGLTRGSPDISVTAMAVQALAKYKEKYSETVERAVSYLADNLTENSGYLGFDKTNEDNESAAQTVIALCAAGIDPETDERFIRNGRTIPEELEAYRLSDGTYCHVKGGASDMVATEQTMLAKLALDKLRSGTGSVYDLTGYTAPVTASEKTVSILVYILPAVVIVAIAAVIIGKKRKK